MNNTCQNCIYFKLLQTNQNFGKCTFPTISLNNVLDIDAVMFAIGYATQISLVHKEDEYSCFVGE